MNLRKFIPFRAAALVIKTILFIGMFLYRG